MRSSLTHFFLALCLGFFAHPQVSLCLPGPTLLAPEGLPPTIFFTDLLMAPTTGGEDNQGAFVTLYGTGFGDDRGDSSVTAGGTPAFTYRLWTNNRITVQLASATRTGPIVVHIHTGSGELNSNPNPFTVTKGRIVFISPMGDDHASGNFQHPWRTLIHGKDALRPGDICYAMDGLIQQSLDKYDSAFSIQTSGTTQAPIALIAYPGATVIIGNYRGPSIAARTPNIDRVSNNWVLAGLTFHGAQEALDITASKNWRVIGNDFSCPAGFGPTGCVQTSQVTGLAFLGNHVHDVAAPGTTKAYHAVYFSTDSNSIDAGWNLIERVRGCRGIQFHSSPTDPGTGHNQFDLRIHDNVIHDVVCDGINLATIDPSQGPVRVENNIIYNVGLGPDPPDGSADYACIYVQGGAEAGPPGSGTVVIEGNTLYNCGARRNTDSGAIALSSGSPAQQVQFTNNIILLKPGEPLFSPNSPMLAVISHSNLLWTEGSSSKGLRATVPMTLRNPELVDPAGANFIPAPGSPAIAAGTPTHLERDVYGALRPTGAPDIGAIQHSRNFAR